MSTRTLLEALVAFEESLVVPGSRFERFYLADDSGALSASEQRGWSLFRDPKLGCAGCHTPLPDPAGSGIIMFRDGQFHNLGIGYDNGHTRDAGRFEVTQIPADLGRFSTPSLRNVALTAPYMHDGSLKRLEDVVAFYARGGIRNPNLDVVMSPRVLSRQDRTDLVAFLRTLTTEWLKDSAVARQRLMRASGPSR